MTNLKNQSKKILEVIELSGLILISIATLIAFGFEILAMARAGIVTLADLLLMFIYLEVLAMVIIYLNSGKLPVRIPLYISIVALARYMILDMKNLDTMRILGIGGAIVLIAIAVLIIRYGHCKYSYDNNDEIK